MIQPTRRDFLYQALCLTLASCTKTKERTVEMGEQVTQQLGQPRQPMIEGSSWYEEMVEEPPTELEGMIEQADKYLRAKKDGNYCRIHGWENLAKDENTSWLVYDLSAEREIVSINADEPRQTASMVKPFVALANYDAIQSGQLLLRDKEVFDDLMQLMLRYSDNVATTLLMRLVTDPSTEKFLVKEKKGIRWALRRRRKLPGKLIGDLQEDSPKKVQAILDKYKIFNQTNITEEISKKGMTYKNFISARDYSRFLQVLWKKELPGSNELLKFMGMSNYDRIKRYTSIPKHVKVYDKTGTTGRLCGNMGILEDNGKAWIFVGIIERPAPLRKWEHYQRNERSRTIRHMSDMTYKWLKKEK